MASDTGPRRPTRLPPPAVAPLHVRIGRIEVHAPRPAAAQPRSAPARTRGAALSLDDYLNRRGER